MGASQFCTKALLKVTESLCLSLLWVMFLQKRDAPKLMERKHLKSELKTNKN